MRGKALTGLLLLALAGCGGGEPERAQPKADPEADRRAVAEHVSTYLRAYATGDGAAACEALTPRLRESSQAGSCEEVLTRVGPKLLAAAGPGERDRLLDRISDPQNIVVTVEGDTATAGVEPLEPGRDTSRVALSRQDGRWLISELGLPAG